MRSTFIVFIFLAAAISAVADSIRVGTLNCYLFFDPAQVRRGEVATEHMLTPDQYVQKRANLTSLISDCGFVGLEEVGGRTEIQDCARGLGWDFAFAAGRDTYTGEQVGAIYHLPGWRVTNNGRVSALDAIVSKHLLVTAKKGKQTLRFLVVHLVRPLGKNVGKHDEQLAAIGAWAQNASAGGGTVVVLGDTNDTRAAPGASIFGAGHEANELVRWSATHLDGKPYDRLVVFGPGQWADVTIERPLYGKRPNELLRTLWTDHFALKATLRE